MTKRMQANTEVRELNTNMRPKADAAILIHDSFQGMIQDFRDWAASWVEVFNGNTIRFDLIAGLTVAAIALPLNIALSIACSLPPATGLIAGLVGGAIAACFGSSPWQISGPSTALSVMVLKLNHDFGITGVAACCLFIGLIQLGLGLFRAGKFVRLIPESVLAGFTTGVGLKLLDAQIPDFLGYDSSVPNLTDMMHRAHWLHEVSWIAVFCGLFVATVIIATKQFKRFPSALIGLIVVTTVSSILNWDVARVGTLPSKLFQFSFPVVPDNQWLDLFIKSIPIAVLASVETLLSASALERMVQPEKLFNPNMELVSHGWANFGTGFFAGMPVSGGVVRSSVNAQSGGKSRLASLFHTLFMGLSLAYLSDYIVDIPLAGLAGLLCVAGARLIDLNTLIHLFKTEKVGAIAFIITMLGSITDRLMYGLILGLALHGIYQFLTKDSKQKESSSTGKDGIRAVLKGVAESSRRPEHFELSRSAHNWLVQIQEKSYVSRSSFVHNSAAVIGRVVLGDNVHIAPESSVRADEGTPFYIGSNSNIQDGAVLHALKSKWVSVGGERWAIFIGKNVSVAHQALVHGPCYVGEHTFIGFKAIVHDSVVGSNCYIGMGAIVVGVEIPSGRYIPHGAIIDTVEKARALQPVNASHSHFNEDVVEVNRGLVEAYRQTEQKSKNSTTKITRGDSLISDYEPNIEIAERF